MSEALDKKQRKAEKREQKAAAARVVRLNPPFPFKARAFDPAFFGLELEPMRTASSSSQATAGQG
jgi:hypothetical protein